MKRTYIYESIDKRKGEIDFYYEHHYYSFKHVMNNRKRILKLIDLKCNTDHVKWDKNPTDEEIAFILDMSSINLSRVINGRVSLSVDVLLKLSWFCDVSTDKIIAFEKELGHIIKNSDLIDFDILKET